MLSYTATTRSVKPPISPLRFTLTRHDEAESLSAFLNGITPINVYGYLDECRFPILGPPSTRHEEILSDNCNFYEIRERDPIKDQNGHVWRPTGYLITVVAPNRIARQCLADLDVAPNFHEIAIDTILGNWDDLETLSEVYRACFVKNWHGKHRAVRYYDTDYSGQRRRGLNFAKYANRLQKITKEPRCFHFEARHTGPQACRTIFAHASDMVDLDLDLFRRHIDYLDNFHLVDEEKLGRASWNRHHPSRRRRRQWIEPTSMGRATNIDRWTGHVIHKANFGSAQDVIDTMGRGSYLKKLDMHRLIDRMHDSLSLLL
jgi:hypothetical protein